MSHHYVAGEGSLWAQPSGPNTQPVYLGCHQLGDVDEPRGDVELIYCPDPKAPSTFRVVNSVQGAAGAVTTSVTTDVTDDFDYLEQVKCTVPLYVMMSMAGRKDVFTNYDRAFVLAGGRITNRGLTGLTARTPDDNTRSEMTFDISAEMLLRVKRLTLSRQSISEANDINDITFCNAEECRTSENVGSAVCQTGYAACSAGAGVTANVLYTTNGGTWAACAADPFAADEDVIAVECFEMSRDDIRVIVAKGTTDAAAPAKIAYSDNAGAAWTVVTVGDVNAKFFISPGSLFALDRNNIWGGLNDGHIHYSSDGGLTWVVQENAVIHAGAWYGIHFADENVGWACGAANIIARTLDGGTTWGAITGPSAQAAVIANDVFCFDRNRVWVSYADGEVWYTEDGGTTWTQRTFSGSGVGAVKNVTFVNEYVGFMARNTAAPVGVILSTIDGGYTWEALTTPSNSGLTRVYACNENTIFMTGLVNAATGFIAKGSL